MKYQLFVSQNKSSDPESRSVLITTVMSYDEMLEQCKLASPDGSMGEWFANCPMFPAREDEEVINLGFKEESNLLVIVARFDEATQAEVSAWFNSLSDHEQALESINTISRIEAVVMNIEALTTTENFIDYITKKHDIARCHHMVD